MFPSELAEAQERVVTPTRRGWPLAGSWNLWQRNEGSLWHPVTQQKGNQNLEGKGAIGVVHVLCLWHREVEKGETGVHRGRPEQ